MTPKRLRASIKKDPVHPSDWLKYETRWSCEDCSHFAAATQRCTLGYNCGPHLQASQQESYERSGKVAFCRFHEID